MDDPRADIDLAEVLAEVDEEVRLRRASGDFPVDLDHELDGIFSSLTPEARAGRELDALLERVEESAFVDADVPTASRIPGGRLVKTGLLRLIGWSLRHVTQQTTAFAASSVRALRLVSHRLDGALDRVGALEIAGGAMQARAREEARRAAYRPPREGAEEGPDAADGPRRAAAPVAGAGERPHPDADRRPDTGWWCELVTSLLSGARGRVLHAEAGDGHLLARLAMIGVDAYGVDPVVERVEAAARRHLDVRLDEAADHLGVVADGALAGLVLTGCVERLPAGELLDLADDAARAVGAGGVVAVVSATPEAWGRGLTVVEADLLPGRPFHPETWVAVLEGRGLSAVTVHAGPTGDRLDHVAASVPGAGTVNANVDLLNAALFGPRTFAVTAVRR